MSRAEWLNGICLIWSRGRLISPSVPVRNDKYLKLSSQKRLTVRNRSVRRSDTTSRGTVVLVFCLRRLPLTLSYHICGNEMNCEGSSEHLTVFTSFTRVSFLACERSSSWLIRTSFSKIDPKSIIL